MNPRYLVTGIVMAGGAAVAAFALSGGRAQDPVPPVLASATLWMPTPLALPAPAEAFAINPNMARKDTPPTFAPLLPPAAASGRASPPGIEPPLRTWSHDIATGETLDTALAKAGLAAADRAEVALALGAEYDLRRLRPGQSLTVMSALDGSPRRVVLDVEDGVRIETVFGSQVSTRVVLPQPVLVTRARETRIESSVFSALDDAGIPERFAVDLAQILSGTVDLRRDLSGGETLRLLWREARVGNEITGQPELAFAALELGDALFEVVWPEDGSGRATIYRDGAVMRVFGQPVEGARISSVFGRRTHPIYGNVRMHTGVDFAAARGTPVYATGPGRISFIGWRGGYGRVVEVAHGSDTTTLYAHLGAVPGGLSAGDRIAAGDIIGNVGATGTATGPNLHYEVRVDGRPTNPLSDNLLADAAERGEDDGTALARLSDARVLLDEKLVGLRDAPGTGEKL